MVAFCFLALILFQSVLLTLSDTVSIGVRFAEPLDSPDGRGSNEKLSLSQTPGWGQPSGLAEAARSTLLSCCFTGSWPNAAASAPATVPAFRPGRRRHSAHALPLQILLGSSKRHFCSGAELHRMGTPGHKGGWEAAWILGSHPFTKQQRSLAKREEVGRGNWETRTRSAPGCFPFPMETSSLLFNLKLSEERASLQRKS